MSGATYCRCDAPHVERVELSPLHIMGPGTFWRAAKPGRPYLAGHGFHFYTEADAEEYAFGTPPKEDQMSTQIVCDFCEEAINGKPKITSTEKGGQKLDFCTTTCFIDFTRGTAATP